MRGGVLSPIVFIASLGAAWAGPPVQVEPLVIAPVPPGTPLFSPIEPASSGLAAANPFDDPAMWRQRYAEFSGGPVGTGVAVGDFDRDGRPDLYVVNKTAPNRLYRQIAPFVFTDVTEAAGVGGGHAWGTGATFADVDGDGWLDLFVCQLNAPNLLYHNNHDGTFTDIAAQAGLALATGSVGGAFADYDRDGDLDLFLVTNLGDATRSAEGDPDLLFRNNGDGTFADVTAAAGLVRTADRGHSATWFDADGDGWPDLHVANDFDAPDHLYRNNHDGTFTDIAATAFPHLPWYAMGADVGDVNNDGRLDLFVADMAGTTHLKRQTFSLGQGAAAADMERSAAPQYPVNALYLNTGGARFLEIARLAGVARTDWTWAPLFADFDNDGWQDLFVTNGMVRDFANTDLIARLRRAETSAQAAQIAKSSPVLAEGNLAYRNTGTLRFADTTAAWGLQDVGVSFGAVAADLDGDGDLDLVYTNFERPVSLYRNNSEARRITIVLRGRGANPSTAGARLIGTTSAGLAARQIILSRGALSSTPTEVQFGLGHDAALARLEIHWPDGRVQVAENLAANTRSTFEQPAAPAAALVAPPPPAPLFREVSAVAERADADRPRGAGGVGTQPLRPLRRPVAGPGLGAADVDGDGDLDVSFTPGDAGGEPRLYLNDGQGVFGAAPVGQSPGVAANNAITATADFDRDGDPDTFVGGTTVPGCYPLPDFSRLLENQNGTLVDVTGKLAPALAGVGRVTAAVWADVNGDGWLDLVIAAEWSPIHVFLNQQGHSFGEAPDSASCASQVGWWRTLAVADVNSDGHPDLIAGNLGLNTDYRATVAEPARLYYGDFDESGTHQIVEAYFEDGQLLPRRNYAVLTGAMPVLRRQFRTATAFGRATLEDLFPLDGALQLEANQLASGVFLNDGHGRFTFHELPQLAQAAPVNAIAARDFDSDGFVDLLLVQNDYSPPADVPRFDGGRGLFLRGRGDGTFVPLLPGESGLDLPDPQVALAVADFDGDGRPDVAIMGGDGTLRVLRREPAGAYANPR